MLILFTIERSVGGTCSLNKNGWTIDLCGLNYCFI